METLTNVIKQIDAWVWGIPLILLILLCGIWLTIRVRGLQVSPHWSRLEVHGKE